MRAQLFRYVLRQYIEHKEPANMRLHLWSNLLGWLSLATLFSQVTLPVGFAVPLLGANLGTLWLLGSCAYFAFLDVGVSAVVLLVTVAWAALPGVPWGWGHGWIAGVVLPLVGFTAGGLAALFSHIYHHEHAPWLLTDNARSDALETTHAVFWGPFHFWLIAALRRGYRPALYQAFEAAERARILRRENVAWQNWAGNQSCRAAVVCVPQTIDDLQQVVRDSAKEGRNLRLVGSGFTWSGWSSTDETLVFCERLDAIRLDRTDPAHPTVWADAGVTNRQLNAFLAKEGLQVPWNVVLETVRVAGIVSVGTHGSGRETGVMGDLVVALEVFDATGERRVMSEQTLGAEGMAALRLGLGLFGVIARVQLRVEPAHRVMQVDRRIPIEAMFAELERLVATKDSVELYWFPFMDWVWVRTFERTDRPATAAAHGFGFMTENFLQMLLGVPFMRLGSRLSILPALMRFSTSFLSFKTRVLGRTDAIHYRRWIEMHKCSCVELGFKADAGFANVRKAFDEARQLVDTYAARGSYPMDLTLNVRFTGPSAALLSPAYGPGITCFIEALCFGRKRDWTAFSAELGARWLAEPTAVPHWAKEFEHIPAVVETVHARLGDRLGRFRRALADSGVDPTGRFSNRLSRRVVGDASAAPTPASAA